MWKRAARIAFVAWLLLALALVHAGAAWAGSGRSFHFSVKGKGAEGFWSTYPADGAVVTGAVYRDTYLIFADEAARDSGERYTNRFAFVDSYEYTFDRRGNFVFIAETFGFAGGADVSMTVDKQLKSAAGSAAMILSRCTVDRRGSWTCSDTAGTVSGSWTGTGDLVRVNDTFHFHGGGTNETSRFRGSFREASGSATMGGADLGTNYGADIFDFTFADVSVTH